MNPRKPSLEPRSLAELREAGERYGVNFTRPIINSFRREAPARIGQLLEAARSGDAAATERAAHSLRGTAAQIGATRLAAFGRYVETRAGNVTERLQRFAPTLESELNRVLAELPGGDEAAPEVRERPTRILIADDEPHITFFLGHVLRAEGYVTDEAATSAAILEAVEIFRPDLILLDWFLADTTADAVLERLHGLGIRVPVIILSARDHEARRLRQTDRYGLIDCLPKPIGPHVLLQALRDAGFPARTA